jgi:hypothetical protein
LLVAVVELLTAMMPEWAAAVLAGIVRFLHKP